MIKEFWQNRKIMGENLLFEFCKNLNILCDGLEIMEVIYVNIILLVFIS